MIYKELFVLLTFLIVSFSCTKNSSEKANIEQKKSDPLVELGHHLYFEKALSKDNSISCNSCHDITSKKPGIDGLATSIGINNQKGGRNAPTVWNAKFYSVQFWDGRAKDLAEQAKGPITNPIEMGMENHDLAIDKIKSLEKYQSLFKEAFPGQPNPINIDNLSHAIAKFEETLVNNDSPYDKFKSGDTAAFNELAKKGFQKFQEIGCNGCHNGAHFAGPQMPLGTGFFMKFPTYPGSNFDKKYDLVSDLGRYEITKDPADKHFWRVPSLRNVALTGPYFHNGKVETLNEAVRVMAKTQLNRELSDEDVESLVEFLKSLSGSFKEIQAL